MESAQRRGAAGATGDRLGKEAFELGEVAEFRPHVVKMRTSDFPHFSAGRGVRRLSKRKEGADLLNAEPESASAADKGQPSDVRLFIGAIGAMPARRPRRWRHEFDAP